MSDDDRTPGVGNIAKTAIVALLLVSGITLFRTPAPLIGARPPVTEAPVHQIVERQDVESRLWQDPFGAVAKAVQDLTGAPDEQIYRKSPLSDRPYSSQGPVTVLAVVVPGGPFSEDAEARRRMRYAVVSALAVDGYSPYLENRIGFFLPEDTRRRPPADVTAPGKTAKPKVVVPLEWFEREGGHSATAGRDRPDPTRFTLVLWISEESLGERPMSTFAMLLRSLGLPSARLAPAGPVAQRQPTPTPGVVQPAADAPREVAPAVPTALSGGDAQPADDVRFQLIGPYASTTLRAMVAELRSRRLAQEGAVDVCPRLGRIRVFSFAATAPDTDITGGPDESLAETFGDCFDLYRTITPDDLLAHGLVAELMARGLVPRRSDNLARAINRAKASLGVDEAAHVALVSELDSFYGRRFPVAMRKALEVVGDVRLERFSYLRGLDGQTAAVAQAAQVDRSAAAGGTPSNALDLIKQQLSANDQVRTSDRPEGSGQFDYLRRVADSLVATNNRLLASGQGSIRAIGVVGSDVFDKLLVLRALRPMFPDAIFFTTDMDAALLMPSERDWTRNLIVASSFGLQLDPHLQESVPPFRSNYQTSVFLSTRLAIADAVAAAAGAGEEAEDVRRDAVHAALGEALSHPRLYEITRLGGMMPLVRPEEAKRDLDCTGRVELVPGDPSIGLCPIHRSRSTLDLSVRDAGYRIGGGVLIAGSMLLFAALFAERRQLRVRSHPVFMLAIAVAIAGAALMSATALARRMTLDGYGESLSFAGVSVWPTIVLECIAVILSIVLILRGFSQSDKNLAAVARTLSLADPQTIGRHDLSARELAWLQTYHFDPTEAAPYDVDAGWRTYAYRCRPRARLRRALICSVLLTMAFIALFVLFNRPASLARDAGVRDIYLTVTILAVFLLEFLIFFALDTTLLFLRLVKRLRRQTNWPDATRAAFQARFGRSIPLPLIDNVIDLHFIEQRTRCIGQITLYPFMVIALLLLSRSALFTRQTVDTPILLTTGLSLIVALGCAVALPRAAEKARDFARERIAQTIDEAKARETADPVLVAQLTSLQDNVEGLRGGAFRPFTQQPVLQSLMFPLSSLGGTALLEYLLLGG